MKATVTGKVADKSTASAIFAINAGDVKLKASITEAAVVDLSSFKGLALSIEKPGSFIVNYDVPNKDVKFQFMNRIMVLEKPVDLKYTHGRGENWTALDGSMVIGPANKVSVNYVFGCGDCKVKYAYSHGGLRRTVFEPCYDVSKNAWDLAFSRKFEWGDTLRATYQTSSQALRLEWSKHSKADGSFKISASFNLAEQNNCPKLMAESTWSCEI